MTPPLHTIRLTETQLRMVIDALDVVAQEEYALAEEGQPIPSGVLADDIRSQYEPILDWDR